MPRSIRRYASIALSCIITVGAIGAMLSSPQLFSTVPSAQPAQTTPPSPRPTKNPAAIISGKPIRITIPASGIDLPIDEGHYQRATKTWTLSPTRAQFAVMTTPPNNGAGGTFIYGHGTDAVFGKIGTNQPPVGTEAHIYTDNGHEFLYTLQTIRNLKPSDTSILKKTTGGPPRLIVQTCTGVFSEWRTMFMFSLTQVN